MRWKQVSLVGYGNYSVSDNGDIRRDESRTNAVAGRMVKQQKSPRGYMVAYLYCNDKRKRVYVHRIVAEEFVPKSDPTLEVNHRDCNKANNHFLNLEWCSRQENIAHSVANGLNPSG